MLDGTYKPGEDDPTIQMTLGKWRRGKQQNLVTGSLRDHTHDSVSALFSDIPELRIKSTVQAKGMDELAKYQLADVFDGKKILISRFSKLPKVLKRRLIRILCLEDYSPSLSAVDDTIEFILESEPGRELTISKLTFCKHSKDFVEIKPLRSKHRSV